MSETLAAQLTHLGITSGTALFVHSSIKAVGPDVRAKDFIEALQASVGDNGTLVFPTFTSRTEDFFDPAETPSIVGVVSEVFRKLPGVLRSRHPRHPVAARGPAAADIVAGHELAVGPCGAGTPFEKHAKMGGQILMVGVDLDTLTLLHTAEAYLDLPYLREMCGRYKDSDGKIRSLEMRQVPGGHRGGVRFFERIFRNRNLVTYGELGRARTMLMAAEPVLDAMVELMRGDPSAALCRNEPCPDCELFKGRNKAKELEMLGAGVSLLIPESPPAPADFAAMMKRAGCPPVFQTIDQLRLVEQPAGSTMPAPPDDSGDWLLLANTDTLKELRELPPGYKGLAYDPLAVARNGVQPFYDILYRLPVRELITDIIVADGYAGLTGCLSEPLAYQLHHGNVPLPLGSGEAQLREMVSALRMRNFSGTYHLVVREGDLYDQALSVIHEFWKLFP